MHIIIISIVKSVVMYKHKIDYYNLQVYLFITYNLSVLTYLGTLFYGLHFV